MKYINILLLTIFLSSCSGAYKYKINDIFLLIAIDDDEDMTLSYIDGQSIVDVVSPTVFSVGYNRNFIIAKQHPSKFPTPGNRYMTNYFIVDIRTVTSKNLNFKTYGPFTQQEFIKKEIELRVPNGLNFTKTFKSLE